MAPIPTTFHYLNVDLFGEIVSDKKIKFYVKIKIKRFIQTIT